MRTIALSDITLKTSNGLALSFKEKIELAKLLDRLNVSGIELAPIQNKKIDSLLVKSVAMAAKNAIVAVPVSQNVESVGCREGSQKAPSAGAGSHEPHPDGVFLAQKAR